jgi:hypothetical protein
MSKYKQMLLDEQAAIQEYINKTMEFYDNCFDIDLNDYARINLYEQRQVLENKLIDINKQLWYIHMIDSKLF